MTRPQKQTRVSGMNPRLADIYAQIPTSACVPNCGKCCGPIMPSSAEIRNVKDWCEERHIEYKDFLSITKEGGCPYLDPEKKCRIYPVRPFLCRLVGVATKLPCPLGKCHASKLLNSPQSDALYKAIYLRGKEKRHTEKHRRLVQEILR